MSAIFSHTRRAWCTHHLENQADASMLTAGRKERERVGVLSSSAAGFPGSGGWALLPSPAPPSTPFLTLKKRLQRAQLVPKALDVSPCSVTKAASKAGSLFSEFSK